MNVPNSITTARIALVPLFVWLSYQASDPAAVAAFAVFAVASASDSLDGYLARRSGTVSPLGEFLDPLADKLLVGAALFVLVDARAFPAWAAVVIAVREVYVQVLRTRIVRRGGRLPASNLAKLKTMVQIGMVSWWLLPWDGRNSGHWAWVVAALIWTVGSGAEYALRARGAVT